MLIDMHMHERTYSRDSALRLEELVATAKALGLDAVCITDHDSMGLRDTAAAYMRKIGFPIFVGVEYYSLEGDIVAFGIDTLPEKRTGAQDFIDHVHRQGGVCFAAHPYRDNHRGLSQHLTCVEGLDGIEAFNASTGLEDNLRALAVCEARGIQPIGVSDCHLPEKVGVYATCLPDDVWDMAALVRSFRRGLCYPVGFLDGRYIDLRGAARLLRRETAVIPAWYTGGFLRDASNT